MLNTSLLIYWKWECGRHSVLKGEGSLPPLITIGNMQNIAWCMSMSELRISSGMDQLSMALQDVGPDKCLPKLEWLN